MNGAASETDELRPRKIDFRIPQVYEGVSVEDNTNEDRYEKPWQRVVFEITKKGLHLYEPVKSVPSIFLILLVGYYCMLIYWTQLIEDDMPSVLLNSEVPSNSWDTFSEEAALKYLDVILGDQPRVSGTKYHLKKTEDLYALVNDIASNASTPVVTDWQIASNNFKLELFSATFLNAYRNVSNIIAVLEGESGFHGNGSTRASLLVNCHYDSVPFAIGASDNGVFCAVMAEALSRLSKRTTKFRNNIIFLFNGAEENTLQGSHAFLQHPWAFGVNAVINLDSAGMNGKPSVFQVTDPRILSAYNRAVKRPSAQGVGEFLFETGIIPSDTDFRIFGEFGGIHGIDIAFTKWGHVYHTRYDHPSLIKKGVVQNAGNTVLATIIAAADMDLGQKADPSAMVYADFLTVFMVSLSYAWGCALDVVVGLLGLLSVAYYVWLAGPRWSTMVELSWAVVGRFLSVTAGAVLTALLASIMIATTIQMRYLTQPWAVVPMFGLPYLIGATAAAQAFDHYRTKKSGLNRSIRTLQAMSATRLVFSLALLVMCCIPSAAPLRYVVSTPLLLMAAAAAVSMTVVRYVKLEGWKHLILEAGLSTPAFMFLSCLALRLLAMMLPIAGRSAGNTPDLTVGLLTLGLAVIMGVLVSGIELLFSRHRLYIPLGVLLLFSIIVMFVPFSPYQDNGPATQRHSWFHTEMVSHNYAGAVVSRQSGVVITKQDAYTATRALSELRAKVNINVLTDLDKQCEEKVYCGLPLYRVPYGRLLRSSVLLYTSPPQPFAPAPRVVATRTCNTTACVYNFIVTVAPHNLITLTPLPNVTLSSWSLSPRGAAVTQFNGRPVYGVLYSTATYSEKMDDLSFTVTVEANAALQSGPLLDVSHHAHKIHHPEDFTAEYISLLNAAPKYFNIASFISFRNDYLF